MSEDLQKQLNMVKADNARLNARIGAVEQISNNVLKDLFDTKTHLNLYMQANNELNVHKQNLEKEIANLKAEIAKLKPEEVTGEAEKTDKAA